MKRLIEKIIHRLTSRKYKCDCGHTSYGPSAAWQHAGIHMMDQINEGLEAGRKKQ